MKLSQVRAKVITDADAAAFEAAVNQFLADVTTNKEREFVAAFYQSAGTLYSCLILYAE